MEIKKLSSSDYSETMNDPLARIYMEKAAKKAAKVLFKAVKRCPWLHIHDMIMATSIMMITSALRTNAMVEEVKNEQR